MHQRTLSKENLVEIFEQSYRFTGVIYFIYLAGGKMILAGWKIILEGGKIILAGWKIILAGGKIILLDGKMILAGANLFLQVGKFILHVGNYFSSLWFSLIMIMM